VSALVTITRLGGVRWLSPLDALFSAEDKLAQQRACHRLNILVPPMVFVTRADRIPRELGEWIVVKPMASGHFFDERGEGRVVHTTEMRRSDDRLALLSGAPFLVQQRIDAVAHLRVVTVGNESWVCELDATDRPVDWRADESAHSSFQVASWPGISARAIALAAHFGLGYSSQDWIVDRGGEPLFIDLNPAGQWRFLPEDVADAATGAIARWLVGEE
jgi:glutathione synthase/RimK-type ligase-like ATP-grasp enzyme